MVIQTFTVFSQLFLNWNLLNKSPYFHCKRAIFVLFLLSQCGSSFPESAKIASHHLQADRTAQDSCSHLQSRAKGLLHCASKTQLSRSSFSVGKLLIKSKLDSLYVMAKLDGGAQL
jgi:hypothetical protein